MKRLIIVLLGILTIFTTNSCKKDIKGATAPTAFTGKWSLVQILVNDYWGGPAYWKTANTNTKIQFTPDGKYFKKYPYDTTYALIGSFQVLSDSTIQITASNPPSPSYPSFILYYNFSEGGHMTWGNFGTGALIKEKYRLDE
jgi:hypothetical protein